MEASERTCVLFVVMEFIPLNLAGVYRPLRFINSLKENGIEPIVITFCVDENLKKVQNKIDYRLNDYINSDIKVIRIPISDITKLYSTKWRAFINIYFNPTDNFLKAWKKEFYRLIPGIITKYKPQAIITTCPPFSSAVLASDLSRKYQLPLILDMRDSWSKLSIQPNGSWFHFLHKRNVERACFRQASAIITVTPQLKDIFQKTHPKIKREKFWLIYNAFNFGANIYDFFSAPSISKSDTINIGYTGSYYYDPEVRKNLFQSRWQRKWHRVLQYFPVKEDWLYRSPFFFLKSLHEIFLTNPTMRKKIFFHHIGEIPKWMPEMVKELDLQGNVKFHGFVPFQKTKELEKTFQYLLTTSEKVIGGEHYCLPSKLFNYINSEKPVLAFITPGIQKDFVLQSGIGASFDPDDQEHSTKKLENIILNGMTTKLNYQYLQNFTEKKTSDQFVAIIKEVIVNHDYTKSAIPNT
jgi:glycosyltransferase involved in cell wall biosynthesis